MLEKTYVDVILRQTREGKSRPLTMIFDDGSAVDIDAVSSSCPMSTLKTGGSGRRYTVVIGGTQSYLYEDRNRWFVTREI